MVDENILEDEIRQFIDSHKTLHLACIANQQEDSSESLNTEPNISYTPFYFDKEKQLFYIYISKLAEHGKYLPTNDKVAIMLIEDEQKCRNLFARKRLSYSCEVTSILRNEPRWNEIISQFQLQFGKIMELLSQFNDFDLYCLSPIKGNYVQGFGKAYAIEKGKIIHLRSA